EMSYSVLPSFAKDSFPYLSSNVVVFQRCGNKTQTEYIRRIAELKKQRNFRMIYDVDDAMFFDAVPKYHPTKSEPEMYAEENYTRELMNLCDEMTVSTPYLKEYYLKETEQKNITVVPNKIPYFWAGHFYSPENVVRNYRKHKKRPRIIYAGSPGHIDLSAGESRGKDDFESVCEMIEKTHKEFKWIFVAACPLRFKKYIQSGDMEYYPWQPVGALPKLISTLEGNMMIAPLADNIYNRGKSNIKLLEASAHGLPIACQDLTPYEEAPIRFTGGDDLLEKIRETLASEEVYVKESLKGREIVDKHWLENENNIAMYKELYHFPYGDARRKNLH
ncbi:hypothetical protein K0U07_03630, partial [bacterium]|nr:hypothetical protein [bacterium]